MVRHSINRVPARKASSWIKILTELTPCLWTKLLKRVKWKWCLWLTRKSVSSKTTSKSDPVPILIPTAGYSSTRRRKPWESATVRCMEFTLPFNLLKSEPPYSIFLNLLNYKYIVRLMLIDTKSNRIKLNAFWTAFKSKIRPYTTCVPNILTAMRRHSIPLFARWLAYATTSILLVTSPGVYQKPNTNAPSPQITPTVTSRKLKPKLQK